MDKGIMKVYYGDGKGKTASAIGQGLLAAAEGESVILIQFLKCRNDSEINFLARLEPEMKLFRFEKGDAAFSELTPEQQAEESMNMKNGMNFARKVLATGECGVLILDEVLGLLENQIIGLEELRALKEQAKASGVELIMTGIHMQDAVLELADEVYSLDTVKSQSKPAPAGGL